MEHVMTFRKLGQKTPTHPFHRLTVKKVPWYYSKSGPDTLHSIFGPKKVLRVLFEILDKNRPPTFYNRIFALMPFL